MSEASFELYIYFKDRSYRDHAIAFINGTGPTYEEEVSHPYKPLFNACETIDIPDEMQPIEETELKLSFELLGSEAVYRAETYMDQCICDGIIKAYGYFAGDDQSQYGWCIIDGRVELIFHAENNPALAELLLQIDENNRIEMMITRLVSSGTPLTN